MKIRNKDKNIAKPMRRLLAYIIDWYVVSLLTSIPIVLLYSMQTQEKTMKTRLDQLTMGYALIALILGIIVSLWYLVYMQTKKGTLGKNIMGIKVVNDDETKVSLKTMLVREGVGILLIEGVLFTVSISLHEYIDMLFGIHIEQYLVYVFGAICFVSIVLALVKPQMKMIHDYIGKTKVITKKTSS